MAGRKLFTKVREAVKGAKLGEAYEWVEFWENFWEGERRNWIKEPERQVSHGDETAEAADIGDLFGDDDEMFALWNPQEREEHQIAPV